MHILYPIKPCRFKKEHLTKVLNLACLTESHLTLLMVWPHGGCNDQIKGEALKCVEEFSAQKKDRQIAVVPLTKVFREGDFYEQLNNYLQTEEIDLLIASHQEINEFKNCLRKGKTCIVPLFP